MIHYEEILNVQKKLNDAINEKKEVVLTEEEVVELAKILKKAQGKLIPLESELNKHNSNIKLVMEYQVSMTTVDLIPPLVEEMNAYNEMYHNDDE